MAITDCVHEALKIVCHELPRKRQDSLCIYTPTQYSAEVQVMGILEEFKDLDVAEVHQISDRTSPLFGKSK
jgi:hypothetical protein